MGNKNKRFVVEAFNHFIKEYEHNELMPESFKNAKILEFNNVRNLYICGMLSEFEALEFITKPGNYYRGLKYGK